MRAHLVASDWKPLRLPYVFERQIAFCIPSAERIVAMSYEGLHEINLGPPLTVSTDEAHAEDYDIYDADRLVLNVGRASYPAMGLHGGCPHPTTEDGLSIGISTDEDLVEVKDGRGQMIIKSDHRDHPPGWLVASFSEDGQLFVVGTPDGLWCWRRHRSVS